MDRHERLNSSRSSRETPALTTSGISGSKNAGTLTAGPHSVPAPWRIGIEIELLAPPGRSRRDLAEAIAVAHQGSVERIFHPQSEFTPVEGAPVFENLTLGFAVREANGNALVKCVDDLTLVDDLDPSQPSLAGWYRVMSDDKRFLSLVERHCDATADQISLLEPLAQLFGTAVEIVNDEPVTRVCDHNNASVAMTASLPGERHRPCELVTAPLEENREAALREYLGFAERLGFSVPAEAATHIHLDASRLMNVAAIRNLIAIFGHYRMDLRNLVGTNPRCRRLGDWPREVYRTAFGSDFRQLDWEDARKKLIAAKPVKYCDFNISNMLAGNSAKDTVEIRILPGSMDAEFILRCIRLFETLLLYSLGESDLHGRDLPELPVLLQQAGLPGSDLEYWQERHSEAGNGGGIGKRVARGLGLFRN
ncbi:MAG: amidoligase family protein [Nitratireductor sp.]|nr:amidoligase family protein [Nitratireductor sp.]